MTTVRSLIIENEPAAVLNFLRELPIGGQNADLGGVFVTSFGEGVQYVAPAPPENSWASRAWVLELKLGRGPRWWQPFQGYARSGA